MNTKRCPRCKRELPVSSFHRNASRKDGLQALCHDCARDANRATRAKYPERYRSPEYYARNNAKRDEWLRADPRRLKAHNAISAGITSGAVIAQPCWVCGAGKAHAHHSSYDEDMRLDVVWLCPLHHKQVHTEARRYV